MAQNKKLQLLKITLIIFAVITLVYGFSYLFFPQMHVELEGSGPVRSGWLRWSGGVLFTLGIGAIMVYRNPAKQGIFITVIALATLIVGLATLHSGFIEDEGLGKLGYTLAPAIINLILSALLWISLRKAKEILW